MVKTKKMFKKVVRYENLIEIAPFLAYGFYIWLIWISAPKLSNKILLIALVLIMHIAFRYKQCDLLPKREVYYEEE